MERSGAGRSRNNIDFGSFENELDDNPDRGVLVSVVVSLLGIEEILECGGERVKKPWLDGQKGI